MAGELGPGFLGRLGEGFLRLLRSWRLESSEFHRGLGDDSDNDYIRKLVVLVEGVL